MAQSGMLTDWPYRFKAPNFPTALKSKKKCDKSFSKKKNNDFVSISSPPHAR